ncbi:MAG: UV DNA damage repair endonuclease UvsE [Bacillota bacterium]|nr:UV DNA damage repair endonuclease UvsE [Bacillota bacterium]MDW7684733.1 UV DNA damage repair endonuclease UvsE [Bacillota bacterium]
MHVRFGFVAMSVTLEKASPSKSVTLKMYREITQKDPKAALEKIIRTARENLNNTLRLLRHCKANQVSMYRFSSKLIPLATHPELKEWNYVKDLQSELAEIGRFIRENGMRVSFHPDHYTLINSPKDEVFVSSINDLAHHCRLLQAMGLDERARLVIHVGGGYNDKENSLERFIENWARVPRGIAKRITLENDDKTFTANETLNLCEKLQLPMVLDIHHFQCNHEEGSALEQLYPRFAATWQGTELPPKAHVSSPKDNINYRSHHDYVDADRVYAFLRMARQYTHTLDVMVEAKQKDEAMFRLVRDISAKKGVTQRSLAALEL